MLLQVENLKISSFEKNKEKARLVKDVSMQVGTSEIVCLVGESGSGKSLTGYSIMGIMPSQNLKITGGEVNFKNENLLRFSQEKLRTIRGKEIFFIPQEPLTALNPSLTIYQQLSELFVFHSDLTKKEIRQKCEYLLEKVKIDNVTSRLKAYPHQLSGGQRQRVLIAMAVALNPSLIIADEPTTALDVSVQWEILELFLSLKKEMAISVLFITHDFGVVKAIADRIYVMYSGKIVEMGDKKDVLETPLHPYTKGLIASVPSLNVVPKTKLSAIAYSNDISMAECDFYARCALADDSCKNGLNFIFKNNYHGALCKKIHTS